MYTKLAVPLDAASESQILPTPAVRCDILTDYAQLERLAPEWERLWGADPEREIFQHFQWIRAWIRAYGSNHSLYAPVVCEGSRVIGVLPLVLRDRRLRFLGYSASDYNVILCEPSRRYEVLHQALLALFQNRTTWDVLTLENAPESQALAGLIADLPVSVRRRIVAAPRTPCPTLVFAESGGLAVLRSKNIIRKVRLLERLGAVAFRHIEDPCEAQRHLERYFRQHVRRAKMADRESGFLTRESVQFCRELFSKLDLHRELRFSVLEVNAEPAAYLLGFYLDGKYIFYKPSFDVNLWDSSPGLVLLYHLLKSLAAEGASEFDFTVGGETYKYRFSTRVRENQTFYLFAPGFRGSLRLQTGRLEEAARGWLRNRPKLKQCAARALAALSEIAAQARQYGSWALFRRALRAAFSWDRIAAYQLQQPNASLPAEEVRVAQLAELADYAAEGSALNSSRLQTARERLKQGDWAYLAARGTEFLEVAWVRKASEIRPRENARPLLLQAPVFLIYDRWTAPSNRSGALSLGLVRRIGEDAAAQQCAIWLVEDNASARAELDKAGFFRSCQWDCFCLFHVLRFNRDSLPQP